jgi:hypothetical protein
VPCSYLTFQKCLLQNRAVLRITNRISGRRNSPHDRKKYFFAVDDRKPNGFF